MFDVLSKAGLRNPMKTPALAKAIRAAADPERAKHFFELLGAAASKIPAAQIMFLFLTHL